VDGDRERIEQVLFNLLANANKYSSTNSVIMLHAAQNNSRVVVKIADAGPIIADKDRRRIFDPYYRGDDDITIRRFPGLGLGLAICKQLVALHRGRMWVTPQTDKGNVFSFTIPIHLPQKISKKE
jgi:signal transduction histidine kinase